MISHKQFIEMIPAHLRTRVADEIFGRVRPDGRKRTCCGQKEAALRVIHDLMDKPTRDRLFDIAELAIAGNVKHLHLDVRALIQDIPDLKKARVWLTPPAAAPVAAGLVSIDPSNPPSSAKVIEMALAEQVENNPPEPA